MHQELKFLIDKVDSSAAPLFLSSEMDRLLNITQEKFITKRVFGNNPRRTSFEEDQKRRDDLRTLISSSILDMDDRVEENKPNGEFVTLPEDYRHAINEEAILFTKEIPGLNSRRRVGVKAITHDRYNKIIDDPFNKPEKNTVYRLGHGSSDSLNRFELICGENEYIEKYHLRYIKTPPEITQDQDCILPEHTHREIVKMAVLEALENIESPRYQTTKIELNEIE
jgi:hypothetical protein